MTEDRFNEPVEIFAEDEHGNPNGSRIATVVAADPIMATTVIAKTEDDPNGRSRWLWVRFSNGDLMLGTFPCGDTYLSTEGVVGVP